MSKSQDETLKNISKIKNWLKTHYNIESYSSNFIKNYLFRCDNNLPVCLRKIENYLTYKKMYPEYLLSGDLKSEDFSHFCKSIYSFYLPELTSDGNRVFVDRITNDESLFDVLKIIQYYCMQTEIRFMENACDNGDIILFDCNNINLIHFVTFIPYFIKALVLILTIYPIQLKLLIFTNTGRIMEFFINLMKFGLPSRMRKVLYVYCEGNHHFSNHVSVEILPKEYGGNLFSLDELKNIWFEKLLNYQGWFSQMDDHIKTADSEKFVKITTTFGPKGSFKNLQIL